MIRREVERLEARIVSDELGDELARRAGLRQNLATVAARLTESRMVPSATQLVEASERDSAMAAKARRDLRAVVASGDDDAVMGALTRARILRLKASGSALCASIAVGAEATA